MCFFDLVISIIQITFLINAALVCLKPNEREKKYIYLIVLIAVCFDSIVVLLLQFQQYSFLDNIIFIIIPCIFFRKNKYKAVLAFALPVFMMNIIGQVLLNIVLRVVDDMLPGKYANYEYIICVYILGSIITILAIKNINYIEEIYNLLLQYKPIYFDFMLSYILAFLNLGSNSILAVPKSFSNIILLISVLNIFFILILFYKSREKSNKIFILFNNLNYVNSELTRIKRKNELQLEYIYNIACLNKKEEIKRCFKAIIAAEGNFCNIDSNKSLLEFVIYNSGVNKDIKVILSEEADISLIQMDELELYRVFSNIINNAVTAINGKGLIKVKTYIENECIFIKIGNNGPKIPKENLEKIFKEGFTTKTKDNDSHGFGLNIVKELVEKNNGTIYVESNEEFTEFIIKFRINNI